MFMEGGSVQDLDRILQVRGNKKSDFSSLVKSVESKNMWLHTHISISFWANDVYSKELVSWLCACLRGERIWRDVFSSNWPDSYDDEDGSCQETGIWTVYSSADQPTLALDVTILIRLSRPLWFFNFCFCVFTFVFNFFEYIFLAFDFRWPFSLTTRLNTGLN